jgi:hypothetical protein
MLLGMATLCACSKPTPDPPPPAVSAELLPAAPAAVGARAASAQEPPESTDNELMPAPSDAQPHAPEGPDDGENDPAPFAVPQADAGALPL